MQSSAINAHRTIVLTFGGGTESTIRDRVTYEEAFSYEQRPGDPPPCALKLEKKDEIEDRCALLFAAFGLSD